MTSLKIEKQSLLAEKNAIEQLLSEAPPDDFFGTIGLKTRLKEVSEKLISLDKICDTAAQAVLYFGGEPVHGSKSIQASFASDCLDKFQKFVAVLYASQHSDQPISDDGPIPFRNESELHITGTPRGSFGFVLEELTDQCSLTDTKLQNSISKASELLQLATNPDDSTLEEHLSELPARVLSSLRDFLGSVSNAGASMRFVSKNTDISLEKKNVNIAYSNTENIKVTTTIKRYEGVFQGATLKSRKFDFQPVDGDLISGKITRELNETRIEQLDKEYMNKKCIAEISLQETLKKNSTKPRRAWTLVDIFPAD